VPVGRATVSVRPEVSLPDAARNAIVAGGAELTMTLAVLALFPVFGSVGLAKETLAVLLMVVLDAVPLLTLTTRMNTRRSAGIVTWVGALIVPVPPTDGCVHDQPKELLVSDSNLVFAGIVSAKVMLFAVPGAALATVMVW